MDEGHVERFVEFLERTGVARERFEGSDRVERSNRGDPSVVEAGGFVDLTSCWFTWADRDLGERRSESTGVKVDVCQAAGDTGCFEVAEPIEPGRLDGGDGV